MGTLRRRARPRDLHRRGRVRLGLLVAVLAPSLLGCAPTAGPLGPSSADVATASATAGPSEVVPGAASPSASSSGESATAPAASASTLAVPLVPVVGFWSGLRSLTTAEIAGAFRGSDARFRKVVVAAPDLAPLTAALGVQPGPSAVELGPEAVLSAVVGSGDVLGFVRLADVRPSVRALAVDGRSLFGNQRLRDLAAWTLSVPGVAAGANRSPDPTKSLDPGGIWTLVAAGDVMLDREVDRRTVALGAGPDFPWAGGTARIVRRWCCSTGEPLVTAARTGNAGAVRALFADADLALVNHEGPAPDRSTYHPSGLVFTFDPALEAGLKNAGIDLVSLANNHIRNAGSSGVLETIRNLDAAGIAHVGAGQTADAARQPAWFTVAGGLRVAVLAYDAIDLSMAGATASRPGAASLSLAGAARDISDARASGAEVVIVVPHWGIEYTSAASAAQRRAAAAFAAAGADVVIGSHPHWVGAMESIGSTLVLFSLGDFIFDLPRSEQTDEGLIVELTFVGRRLAQLELHPTIELDRSQPNLLDPTGDGRVVIDRIRAASRAFLGW